MLRKIKEKAKEVIAAGTLLVAGLTGLGGCQSIEAISPSFDTKPKACVTLTEIAADKCEGGSRRIDREEVLVTGLSLDGHAYATRERTDDSDAIDAVDLYKTRLQATPVGVKADGLTVKLGAAHESVKVGDLPGHKELGGVVSLITKPSEKSLAKMDFRYFPSIETLETYGFLDTPDVYVDILNFYNTETGFDKGRISASFKITDWLLLGPEIGFSGEKIGKMGIDYFGLGVKLTFK